TSVLGRLTRRNAVGPRPAAPPYTCRGVGDGADRPSTWAGTHRGERVPLEDLWNLTRRHVVAIAVCALVGVLLAFGWMLLQPKVYTASSSGYVSAGGGQSLSESFSSQTLAQQKAQAYVTLFTNRNVAKAVIDELGLDATPSELVDRITASVPPEGVTIDVTASAPTAAEARDIADADVGAAADDARPMEETGPR